MTGFKRFVHGEVPAGDRVESIDDTVQPVGFLIHLREPAASENAGELTVLFREHMGPGPAIGTVRAQWSPTLTIAQIRRRLARAATLRLHTAAGDQLA